MSPADYLSLRERNMNINIATVYFKLLFVGHKQSRIANIDEEFATTKFDALCGSGEETIVLDIVKSCFKERMK